MSADDEARLERLRGLARGGVGIPRQTDAQFIVAQLDAAQERVRELEQHKCWTLSQRVNDVEAERDALAQQLTEAQAQLQAERTDRAAAEIFDGSHERTTLKAQLTKAQAEIASRREANELQTVLNSDLRAQLAAAVALLREYVDQDTSAPYRAPGECDCHTHQARAFLHTPATSRLVARWEALEACYAALLTMPPVLLWADARDALARVRETEP